MRDFEAIVKQGGFGGAGGAWVLIFPALFAGIFFAWPASADDSPENCETEEIEQILEIETVEECDEPENPGNDTEEQSGSITVCKILVDEQGAVFDGSDATGTVFTIPGFIPAQTSEAPAIGQIAGSVFQTPLDLNARVLPDSEGNDSECRTHGELAIGSYYYGREIISGQGAESYAGERYNDQYTIPIESLSEFFGYDSELFDGDAGNDEERNKNADGHIVLLLNRPDRTLVVLNERPRVEASSTATLLVRKVVVNDDDGISDDADFTLSVKNGDADVSGSPAAGSATGTEYILAPGTYTVSEDNASGYARTFGGDCDENGEVVLQAGDDKSCVVTNDDQLAQGGDDQDGGGAAGPAVSQSSGGGGGGGGSPANPNLNVPAVSSPPPAIDGAISVTPPGSGQVGGIQLPDVGGAVTTPRTGFSFAGTAGSFLPTVMAVWVLERKKERES